MPEPKNFILEMREAGHAGAHIGAHMIPLHQGEEASFTHHAERMARELARDAVQREREKV